MSEREIWVSVIIRAVADTMMAPTCGADWRDLREARNWLDRDSADFRTVCELAGFEPEYVRKRWLDGTLSEYVNRMAGRTGRKAA